MIHVVMIETVSGRDPAREVDTWLEHNVRAWARPTEQCWLADGALAAEQIMAGLEPLLDPADRLLVVKTGLSAVWQGVEGEVEEWLLARFPDSLTERVPGESDGIAH